MKYKYTKYVPNLLDELDMDELMSKLSDLLMSSGFGNPRDTGDDSDRTMQALHDAILEALFNGGVLPDDLLEKMFGNQAEGSEQEMRDQLEQLIQQIIEQMKESGYISTPPDLEPEKARRAMGGGGEGEPAEVKFEVTDKALDFLGYRALRDLLGSAGPQQRRPSRHARPVDRDRSQRRAQAVRIRRRDESRCHRDDSQRGEAARTPKPRPGSRRPRPRASTSTIPT